MITSNRKTTMFEIEIPIENGGISYINDERMPISPNMIICAKPGQTRHTKTPYKCYYAGLLWSDTNSLGYTLQDIATAIKEVAKVRNVSKNEVYQEYHKK